MAPTLLACARMYHFLLVILVLSLFLSVLGGGEDNKDKDIPDPPTYPGLEHISVVLARHGESVEHLNWIRDYPHVIYNRGDEIKVTPQPDKKPLRVIDLNGYANCGRESYIYLSHIIHNYNRLANITIFSLAHHNDEQYSNTNFQADVEGFAKKTISFKENNDEFMFLVPTCTNLFDFLGGKVDYYNKKYGTDRFDVLWDGFKDILNFKQESTFRFAPGSVFAVTREGIHRNPKEFYFELAKTLTQ